MTNTPNTVNVTVDLDRMADGVENYYNTMQEGQLAEMFGDNETAFTRCKEVITIMAAMLEEALGTDNVVTINNMVSDRAIAKADAETSEG